MLIDIDYERNPTIDIGDSCPDSSGLTRIKCAFWSSAVTASQATNVGQNVGNFKVVITGSNAYTTYPQPQAGFSGPVDAGGASINAPAGTDTYMGEYLS